MPELNAEQKQLATPQTGPVLGIASAGTGKTETITRLLANLISSGINPKNILMLTFTNKAAKEMSERAERLLNYEMPGLTACTYHTFCASLLRRFGKLVGVSPDFAIASDSNCNILIATLKEETSMAKDKNAPSASRLSAMFSMRANREFSWNDIITSFYPMYDEYKEEIMELEERYQAEKKRQNLLDYDDLLVKTVELLRSNDVLAQNLSDNYQYILVDEYQDSNIPQMKILKLLRQFDNKNLVVVGDDAQTIYTWRGSNLQNIIKFPDEFQDTKIIVLNQNYRSNQEILDLGTAIANNAKVKFEKSMEAQFSKNELPVLIRPRSNFDEAYCVLNIIQDYINNKGYSYSDIAILERAANDSNYFETILAQLPASEKIPYKKYGGLKFLEKEVCQDMIAFLNILNNSRTQVFWIRFLSLYEGIGKKTALAIAEDVFEHGIEVVNSPKYQKRKFAPSLRDFYSFLRIEKNLAVSEDSEVISKQIQKYIKYYHNLKEKKIINSSKDFSAEIEKLENDLDQLSIFIDKAKEYKSLNSFLDDLNLDMTNQEDENETDFLTISTIHSAKGLEWKVVIIINCTDSSFPGERKPVSFTPLARKNHQESIEESRRLLYVAVTRAKEDLYILAPQSIVKYGGALEYQSLSRFLTEDGIYEKYCLDVPAEDFLSDEQFLMTSSPLRGRTPHRKW